MSGSAATTTPSGCCAVATTSLAAPPTRPFPTMESAFTPQNMTPYFERVDDAWTVWPLWFPPIRRDPAPAAPMPSIWDDLVMAMEAIVHGAEAILHLTGPARRRPAVEPPHPGIVHWLTSHVPHPSSTRRRCPRRHPHPAHTMPRDPARPQPGPACVPPLAARTSEGLAADPSQQSGRRGRPVPPRGIELDLGLTLVIGCLRDGVPTAGYEAIDGEDARAWFARHGAAPTSVDSTPIRALYDLYLAYEGGDQARPAIAAGVAIHAVLRLALGYKGDVVNEMRAGMGEVVIAPVYETLAARGVKFAFFHRVERLELSADRSKVERIHIARQVELKDETTTGYRPLQPVDGLPCWPSSPLIDQIKNGEAIGDVDLESRWNGWHDVDHPVLEAGHDFDVAVLGSRSARSTSCVPTFGRMTAGATCSTTSARPRAAPPSSGWTPRSRNSAGRWVRPGRRRARAARRLGGSHRAPATRALAGTAPALAPVPVRRHPRRGVPPPADRHRCPGRGARPGDDDHLGLAVERRYRDLAGRALGGRRVRLEPAPRPSRRHRAARLTAQYLRANIDPSERYVLSLPGTVQYRMAADGSGYDNLILAGDWTKTDWNVGCIEAAVTSGINAAAAVEGEPGAEAS